MERWGLCFRGLERFSRGIGSFDSFDLIVSIDNIDLIDRDRRLKPRSPLEAEALAPPPDITACRQPHLSVRAHPAAYPYFLPHR